MIAETEDDLTKRCNEWKDNRENRGMRVNMNKTKKCSGIKGSMSKVKSFIYRSCLLLQPFYSSLDFVRDYLGEPVPER